MSTTQIPLYTGTGKGRKKIVQVAHATIDLADLPLVSRYTWMLKKCRRGRTAYAIHRTTVNGRKTCTFMHRLIMGLAENDPREVDHVNHDGTDNRRENLRVVSHGSNCMNLRLRTDSRTGFKGVSYHKASGKYAARIARHRLGIHLGLFPKPEEAAVAYNTAAAYLFGPHAWLNTLPDESPAPERRAQIAAETRRLLSAYRPAPAPTASLAATG